MARNKTDAEIARKFRDDIRDAARLALDRTGRVDMRAEEIAVVVAEFVRKLNIIRYAAEISMSRHNSEQTRKPE